MLRRWLLIVLVFTCPSLFGATFVVDSSLDTPDSNKGDGTCEATSGGTQCTLRAAIEEANSLAGFDVIEFSIGLVVIDITGSALPPITTSMRIDGRTAPSYNRAASDVRNAPPSVHIDGDGLASSSPSGLSILNASDVEIRALGITGFPNHGISASNTNSLVIDSTWIGVTRGGAKAGNTYTGVLLDDCTSCTIGSEAGRGNVVSNNGDRGIWLLAGSDNNLISSNYIGLDPIGPENFGNTGHGIYVQGDNNTIGESQSGNQIGFNTSDGIRITGTGQSLFSNYVFENNGNGISVNAANNTIGNTFESSRNIVEANGRNGIEVGTTNAATDSTIWNTWVFGNQEHGIIIYNGTNIRVLESRIWDNSEEGVQIDASGNAVADSEIGLTAGVVAGNGGNGVLLNGNDNSVSRNDIGGVEGDGIVVGLGNGNEIKDNYIGTNSANEDLGNQGHGIRLGASASAVLIQENTIGHNGGSGIWDEGSIGTEILRNHIGSGTAGENFGNTGNGIALLSSTVDTGVIENVIGHNGLDGLLHEADNTQVCGNWIGVAPGYQNAANAIEGIRLRGDGNTIGNLAAPCIGNRIGFNISDGIQVEGSTNVMRNNFLGGVTVQNDDKSFGNVRGGILLTTGSSQNDVRDNTIRNNGDHGIRVNVNALNQNLIRRNEFRSNSGLAIDLELDGPTPNDAGDPDEGPNRLQNTPELDQVLASGDMLEVTYRVNSDTENSSYFITVDFYVSATNKREGVWVQQNFYAQAANSQKTISVNPGVGSGYIMAMATDADGNSSEFSAPIAFEAQLPEMIFQNGFED